MIYGKMPMKFLDWLFKGEPSQKEKRSSDRIRGYVPASLVTPDHQQMVEIFDLSDTGCGISAFSSYFLKQHDIVQMQVIYVTRLGELYVSQAPIDGVIVRNINEEGKKRFGIRFLNHIDDKNAMLRVLEDLRKNIERDNPQRN
jgi:hypothetical protein